MVRNMNLLFSGEGTKESWTGTWHDTNDIPRSLLLPYRERKEGGHGTRYESSVAFQVKKNKNCVQNGGNGDRK